MDILISIVLLIFGILQIVLFFKIWGMTDDIREIKNKYLSTKSTVAENEGKQEKASNNTNNNGLLVVELKTEKQMRLGERLENGNYKCYIQGTCVGEFAPSEFMEFNKWSNEVYKK